jgi:hypothetical protein
MPCLKMRERLDNAHFARRAKLVLIANAAKQFVRLRITVADANKLGYMRPSNRHLHP